MSPSFPNHSHFEDPGAKDAKPASKSQTRAIFFASGLDARPLGLTYAEASDFLDRLKASEAAEAAITELQERGATGSPKVPKAVRDARHAALFERAWAAGVAAAQAHTPVPMTVVEYANPLADILGGDPGEVVRQYEPVADGACGFAWVTIHPGNSSFARWLTANNRARPHYRGGVQVWISDYNQSYERKSEHARAMAAALREEGVQAYSGGRLD
jgi:hypothetical protein